MVTYSSSFLQFLKKSDSRIAKILWKIHDRWDYYSMRYKDLITTDSVNYITFRKDGTISFLPAGKEHKVGDDGDWARDGRQNGKPGKVIQKLFTDKMLRIIPNKEFETFSNSYKAAYNNDGYEFSLLDNKKIPSVYCMSRRPGGRLEDSCMNGDKSYLDIYKNCESLKILILKDEAGNLCGRALVWFLDEGFVLMDRVYTSDDFMDEMFLQYAKDKGWHRKYSYRTYENKTSFVTPDGKRISKDLKVITPVDFDSYPYIDTFSYGDDSSLNNYGDGCYTYDQTNGCRDGDDNDDNDDHYGETYDEISDEYISQDDAVHIDRGDRRGCWTHQDNTVEVNGHTYWEGASQIIRLSWNDEWYLTDEVVYSQRDSEDYPESECVNTGDDWILRDEATEINGKWYHDDDVVYSRYSRETYIKDECVESKRFNSWLLKEDATEKDGDWWPNDELPEEDEDDEEKEIAWVDQHDRVTVTNDPNQILLPF